jgi:Cu(I)/Ag(I) efflux system membrane protein CusA/SilA
VITEAAAEVGPALFFSPADHHAVVHSRCSRWRRRKGRLFAPLAFTKTYAMAAAAGCR